MMLAAGSKANPQVIIAPCVRIVGASRGKLLGESPLRGTPPRARRGGTGRLAMGEYTQDFKEAMVSPRTLNGPIFSQ